MSNETTIIYNGSNQHTYTLSRDVRMTLKPGRNQVDAALYHRMSNDKNSQVLKAHIEARIVEEFKPTTDGGKPVQGKAASDVSKMKADDAITLIENTMDAAELETFAKQESDGKGRTTVLDAIEVQAEKLAATGAPPE